MKQPRGFVGAVRRHAIFALTVMSLSPMVAGCQQRPDPAGKGTATSEVAPSATAPIPTVSPPADRNELLAAAAAATDRIAAGRELPKANLDLANRTFEVRLPFACSDGVTGAWGRWSLDPQTGVLRVTFGPQLWGNDPTFKAIAAGMRYDAAEGFWIERPWTSAEDCPTQPDAPAPPTQLSEASPTSVVPLAEDAAQTLALVQYFHPDASRTLRRGNRPYTYTTKLPVDGEVGPQAFRVRIAGRITGFPGGQPIHCHVAAPSRPPICAVAVEFTSVVLEDAITGRNLAEWGN